TTVTCDGVTQRVGDGAPAVAAATRSGTVAAVAAVGAGADRVIVRSRYAVGDADPVVGDCQAAVPAIASGERSTGFTGGTTRQQEAEQAARSQDAAQATVASVATTCIEVGGGAPTPVAAVAAEAEQQAATPTVASVAAGDALIRGHGGGHGVCAVLAADVAAVTPVTAVAEQETAPAPVRTVRRLEIHLDGAARVVRIGNGVQAGVQAVAALAAVAPQQATVPAAGRLVEDAVL